MPVSFCRFLDQALCVQRCSCSCLYALVQLWCLFLCKSRSFKEHILKIIKCLDLCSSQVSTFSVQLCIWTLLSHLIFFLSSQLLLHLNGRRDSPGLCQCWWLQNAHITPMRYQLRLWSEPSPYFRKTGPLVLFLPKHLSYYTFQVFF